MRVPAAEYEHFCEQVGSLCHVTYMSSSAENITEEYYDTDSRLKTAQIKLERLQELLSKADNMADIITIESAISDTEYEIESLSGHAAPLRCAGGLRHREPDAQRDLQAR